MANAIFAVIFSLRTSPENSGTNIKLKDSSIAISFNCTPLLIAQMFMSRETKNTQ